MRKIVIALLLFFKLAANAQVATGPGSFPVKGELVTVNDWGSRALYFISDSYFAETKDSIISQIGTKEFDEMEIKCGLSGWPKGLYMSGLTGEEDKAFDVKLGQLKMYRIAIYTHIYNGKIFDRYAILRVPFDENKSWDPAVQWDGSVYFLLKEKDVQTVKQGSNK